MSKVCKTCGIEKSDNSFTVQVYKNKNWKSHLHHECKECARKTGKTYKHSRRGIDTTLRRNYGITLEDFDKLFLKQNNGCAICGKLNKNGFRLAVDHNHKTGKIRGLLCSRCNSVLGNIEDNKFLIKALSYLREYE